MLEIPAAWKIAMPFMLATGAASALDKKRVGEAVIIGLMGGGITFMGGKYVALPVGEEP